MHWVFGFISAFGVTQEAGHDSFHALYDISQESQGVDRVKELIAKYPVLMGMLSAFLEQAISDQGDGAVGSADLELINQGFGMALGAVALLAESEIPDTI